MLWKGRRQSDNVEDERSDSGGGGFGGGSPGQFRVPIGGRTGGGGSILLVILVVLAGWYFGFDPSQILGTGDSGGVLPGGGGQITDNSGGQDEGAGTPASDEMKQFVATVLAETEETWTALPAASLDRAWRLCACSSVPSRS
jgi:predicted metalloprotease